MDCKKELEDLMHQKSQIEEEISINGEILKAEGNVGMTESLVDAQGFPRNDIDLYKVRAARQRINCLQNDYKAVMNKIEQKLGDYHSTVKDNPVAAKVTVTHKPFIKVTQVDQGSPAQEAGLEVNDEIVQFGPCLSTNTDKKLTQIAELVRSHENKIILLNVARDVVINGNKSIEMIKVKLIPKKWSGHGLLGCKIVPID